ncbi:MULTISPECIES: hypothetical protein [unclassified Paenibacillus]|uniref:hypothetical protein n=1 Tax=unclassified Paenibacillus TaxID=185978 RepID=UPI001AE208B4|nr:hypothetical protein [Paenibacillus sp. PvR133]
MDMMKVANVIFMDKMVENEIYSHCIRKLNCHYMPEETMEQQAFGLVGGRIDNNVLSVQMVIPLCENFRYDQSMRDDMNEAIINYSIPAELAVEERAWTASPKEVQKALALFDKYDLSLIGSYHMHHENSWNGIQSKELPSKLDEYLARDSEMVMFIVYISDTGEAKVRAFYEGKLGEEIKIFLK